ncbi:type I-E CRISPR-associated protein Cse1/CasA [Rothia koreensis]|uniref:type I-E CRISPR-associated protein Cse1/CasA n=1 Tax=Rothia koreensis TaxID=592378 RepID=UPI003FCEBE40
MADQSRPSFDLWSQAWIPVKLGQNSLLVSIQDFFDRAGELAYFEGEVPTMPLAIQRILSTVLRQAVEPRQGENGHQVWARIWKEGRFPMDEIRSYGQAYSGRFDLFHPERPFLQAPGLATVKNEYLKPAALLSTVPRGSSQFTSRAGEQTDTMSPAEAAQWVIHAMGFDVAGIKPGALGDDRAKGGKGYGIGTGWLGRLGAFRLVGKDLFETLMFNTRFQGYDDAVQDMALWERDDVLTGAVSRPENSQPRGDADLYTWPSRRIRLHFTGTGEVDGVLITQGDRLLAYGQERTEPASFWRNSPAQAKALGTSNAVFMPRSHDPNRAAWQRIDSVLAHPGTVPLKGQEKVVMPLLISQLRELIANGVLSSDTKVLVETVGLVYGTQDSVVTDMYSDRVSFASRLLLPPSIRARARVVDIARLTDEMAHQVAYRVKDAREAAGASGENTSATVLSRLYFDIDPAFRRWLNDLDVDRVDEHIENWCSTLFDLLMTTAKAEMLRLGPRALVGRSGAETARGTSALSAFNALVSTLRKRLKPIPADTPREGAHS